MGDNTMDLATVPVDLVDNSEDDVGPSDTSLEMSWGRLIPLDGSFIAVELKKDEYTFGRGEECDCKFNSDDEKKMNLFLSYSKVHFKLIKEESAKGSVIFLCDCSSNGTYVNGEKVGKNSRRLLHNNDEISLASKKNKVYIFMDATLAEDADLPKEIRDKYTVSRTLGRGACGEVRLAFVKGSCHRVAIKIVQKKKFENSESQKIEARRIMNEVNIMKSLKHPCIVNIEEVLDSPEAVYIVLELVEGGELFDRVVSVGHFEEPFAKFLFLQMVYGVKYLHDRGITHRDLKPENILLTSDTDDCQVKVTDFGISKFVDQNTMMKTFCGTPNYLAPEILKTAGTGSYTNAVDCWSLGVILYICLVGYPPFSADRKDMTLPEQIVGGHYSMPDEHWKKVSADAKDLVRRLLTVKTEERITLANALEHPWLKDSDVVGKVHHLLFPEAPMEMSLSPSLTTLSMPSPPKRKSTDNGVVGSCKKVRKC